MKEAILAVKNFFNDRFNLHEDKAEERVIVAAITREVSFKGTNLWTLIFAIMIASIGLNVNSTAVIIGAMLISPLMGPIMGIGLAVGTNDIDLLKKGIKNLGIAVCISIITSTIYFSITPLHTANSELLARTNPSLWDVFIAFFGGLAGIVAGTRRQKSTVVPGVAIATALMPPLCTAGFGLATGKWEYLFGALYLFFINSMFICLATFLIVKHLGYKKHIFKTTSVERKVVRFIWVIVTITILPSIYLAYKIVERSIFESNAKSFVQKEFNFSRSQVVSRTFKIERGRKSVEVLIVGQELPKHVIDSVQNRMPLYGLTNAKLIVHQGLNAKQEIDLAQIKASILEDVYKDEMKKDTVASPILKIDLPIPDLRGELKSLFPEVTSYSLAQTAIYNMDSITSDTVSLFTAVSKKLFSLRDRSKLQTWLKERIKSDSIVLIIDLARR